MEVIRLPLTAGELSAQLGASLVGDSSLLIEKLGALAGATPGTLAFLADKKFIPALEAAQGLVVLTQPEWLREDLPHTFLLVENPKKAFASVASGFRKKLSFSGISALATIHPSAKIAEGVSIGPGSVVCEGAVIGKGTTIYPSVYVGTDVTIGENCEIHPFVSLVTRVTLGNRVKVFSGSVLGSDGFGFLEGESGYTEMPQIGSVVIGDDVRIGAKCTIDRGTLGETRVGRGTKIDDQVHIGHNCQIGENCILCGQVALAGSCTLEDGVILGGQVGVGGHVTIGKGAAVGGQTGVGTDLAGNERYFQTPAMPLKQALRSIKHFRRLPELVDRVRKLEETIHGKN